MSSSKENFIVDWKIRLPGSKTPVVFPLHLGMTAGEAISVICRHFSLRNKKLTVVISPTATNPGRIICDDTVLRSIEDEIGSEDILELWKSPYVTKAAVVDGTTSIGYTREVAVDASRELSQMIPIFQRAFGLKEEFGFQYSPTGGGDDNHFKSVSILSKAKWLSVSDSLVNQRIPTDSYILLFPIALFEKFSSTLLQKTPLIREGLLQKQSKTKNKVSKTEERWCVLNEGFLFYFKKKGDSTPRGVLTLEYYTIKHHKVENDKKNRWVIQLSKVFASEFVSKHGDCYLLYGPEQEVKDWAANIAQKCYNTGTRKEFGVDLHQAVQRRLAVNNIPRVMQDCIEYLKQDSASTQEGLFRIPGSASLIEYYKDQYDQGEEVSLSECNDPHTVAGLLKLYVREMPEPLLTFDLYDKLLNSFENYYETGEKIATEQLGKVLVELPSLNSLVLRYLCSFLFELGKNHQRTKMTVSNLATVFGPNLIRSPEEDVTLLMKHAPAINNILELLITNQEKIFGSTGGKALGSFLSTINLPRTRAKQSPPSVETRGWTMGKNREPSIRSCVTSSTYTPAEHISVANAPAIVEIGSTTIVGSKIGGKDRASLVEDNREMEIVRLQKLLFLEREGRARAEAALEECKIKLRELEGK